jgi:uracil-DNA glycosylase family 4
MTILDELADVVADLRAHLEYERLGGSLGLPTEPVTSVDLGPELPKAPAAAPVRRERRAGGEPRRGPSERATTPTAPRRETPVAARPSAPAAPGPAALPPGPGKWAQFDRPSGGASLEDAAKEPGSENSSKPVSLESLRQDIGDCQRCGLCEGRTQLVFGTGPLRPSVMVIGEAPGYHEDQRGEPFVGKAGKMLDKMAENVLGLSRDQIYITNVVKCRPPDNRKPEAEEMARCRPFLMHQIRIVEPRFLLVLGSVACRALFGPDEGVTRLRGKWKTVSLQAREIRAMPTFHPAYLLRQPQDKRLSFADLKLLREALDMGHG